MASVYNRGSRSKVRWYARVRLLDGTWTAAPTHANNKEQAQTRANEMQQRADKGLPIIERTEPTDTVDQLMETWLESLENRNAGDDRSCTRLHVLPCFAELFLAEVTMKRIVAWLDKMRAAPEAERLSSASQRKCFNLLSRFFSWAIEREHTTVNPCRMLPTNSKARPRGTVQKQRTWLQDDESAKRIFHELSSPFHLIFLTGYIGGLRPGEVCGLRLSDLDYLDEQIIRVRFSRLGPLKEDKCNGPPKVKWAPASNDLIPMLKAWRKRREDEDAQPEDLLFPQGTMPREDPAKRLPGGTLARLRAQWAASAANPIQKAQLSREWRRMKAALAKAGHELAAGLDLYSATRHTFTNRQLASGEHLEAVSDVLGHSDPRVTKKHYAHLIRKTFPESMHRGLGLTATGTAAISVAK